jgi:hypothetical protein
MTAKVCSLYIYIYIYTPNPSSRTFKYNYYNVTDKKKQKTLKTSNIYQIK